MTPERGDSTSASSMLNFWVAKLAKSFGRIGNPKRLGDFRYVMNPKMLV